MLVPLCCLWVNCLKVKWCEGVKSSTPSGDRCDPHTKLGGQQVICPDQMNLFKLTDKEGALIWCWGWCGDAGFLIPASVKLKGKWTKNVSKKD